MDPVAHTLVGASLAETGLREKTALATPTLIIGANLPDIDAFAMMWGRDAGLHFRRGWTHGVLAMVVLPLALAGAMTLWHRFRPARDGPPLRAGPLLMVACIGVWSHPALDWLNTYGVRLLMPFDGRWFYGDSVYIVDPWMWLLAGAAVVLARSRTRPSVAGWIVLGTAMSGLVLASSRPPLLAKLVWAAAVLTLVAARWRRGPTPAAPRVALACLAGLALYVGAMLETTAWARDEVAAALRSRGDIPGRMLVGPVAAHPTARDGVAIAGDDYVFFDVDRSRAPAVRFFNWRIPVTHAPDPAIDVAKAAPSVRGFLNWARFPHFESEPIDGGGHRVWMRDLRYVTPSQTRGFGIAVVDLDAELRPVATSSMRR